MEVLAIKVCMFVPLSQPNKEKDIFTYIYLFKPKGCPKHALISTVHNEL